MLVRPLRAMAEDNSWAYKQVLRATIARQTKEYLDNGGEITQVHVEDNHSFRHPIKLSRREQVRWAKKYLRTGYSEDTD